MQKFILLFLLTSAMMCLTTTAYSQAPATVKYGPKGVYIFLGKEIPTGKIINGYSIERTEDNEHWTKITEVKTPLSFETFNKAMLDAKGFFPSQPLPQEEKLRQIYSKATLFGTTDSLRGMRLLFPVRVALGIMYYDTSAREHITYHYRVNGIKPDGNNLQSLVSDTISLPFKPKFDTITYCESSFNTHAITIKWKSIGKNPAPLFMVFQFYNNAPHAAHGKVSRYTMNDTTYFGYYDTAYISQADKEMQFFISPYDYLSNVGLSSQVAVITHDDFNKAFFFRNHTDFMPKLSGAKVCWHFSDVATVKSVEIYRSENEQSGYKRLNVVSGSDTSYLDQLIWPEKTFYYYVQAIAKAGKRTKQSDPMMIKIPGLGITEPLKVPKIIRIAQVNHHVRLFIEVNDTTASHIRVYRGAKETLLVAGLIENTPSGYAVFTDTNWKADAMKDWVYAVRNEKVGFGISGLSEQLAVPPASTTEEIEYVYALPKNDRIELYWDDVLSHSKLYKSYTLGRQIGGSNSKSPLTVIAEKLTTCSFIDKDADNVNKYTYSLKLMDDKGNSSQKTFKVTTKVLSK